MNILKELYREKAAIDRGKYFLLDKKIAIQFLSECKKENIRLLGIDGFYKIDENVIQPSMENSIDFSTSSYKADKNNVYESARSFIESRDNDLYFEIIYAE